MTGSKAQDRFDLIKSMDKLLLTAEDIAPVIGCNPNDIRGQARDKPDLLGFPVVVYASRVKIPRLPFIQFIERLPCCCAVEGDGDGNGRFNHN